MKNVTVEEFAKRPRELIDEAQGEQILITRRGEPVAVLVGVENLDEEDYELQSSPEFWRMIEEARRQPAIPLAEARKTLLSDES